MVHPYKYLPDYPREHSVSQSVLVLSGVTLYLSEIEGPLSPLGEFAAEEWTLAVLYSLPV